MSKVNVKAKEYLLNRYKKSLPVWQSESLRLRYPYLVSQFLDHAGIKKTYTKQDIISFFNHLSARGIANSTIRWSWSALKSFCEFNDCPMPLDAKSLPGVREVTLPDVPVMSKDKVGKMIKAVIEKGSPGMRAVLLLSTVYGLRRAEIGRVTKDSIKSGRLYVDTAKGGIKRWHTIPQQIRVYLKDYDYPRMSDKYFGDLFKRMQKLADIKTATHDGYHMIRRSLVTELLMADVPIAYVVTFMRWKQKSALGGIIGQYAKVPESTTDKVVFEKHPFLGFWGANGGGKEEAK